LSVIEVDSINVEKAQEASSAGILYPGQRMDLILRLPTEEKTSSLTIEMDPEYAAILRADRQNTYNIRCMKYPNPALTPNQLFAINPEYAPEAQSIIPDDHQNLHLDIQHIPSPTNVLSSLPRHTNITDIVYVKTQKFSINHNVPYGYFNHTSWAPQQDPPVPLNGLSRAQWDRKQLALVVGHQNQNPDEPVWVDLVVNNLDDTGHPFHLVSIYSLFV
jgi:FtsP/CotA-like multicopper oxidase with cupredoxin domain